MASDLQRLVSSRYSCRKFSDEKVKEEDLRQIMQTTRLSPSACNLQPYHFYAVCGSSFEKVSQLRSWYGASTIIVCCVSNNVGWVRSSDKLCLNLCDLGIALSPMMLQASELGLATCVIGSFNPNDLAKALDIPHEYIPVVALAIGYSAKDDKPGMQHDLRKSVDEIFTILN